MQASSGLSSRGEEKIGVCSAVVTSVVMHLALGWRKVRAVSFKFQHTSNCIALESLTKHIQNCNEPSSSLRLLVK